MTSWAILPVIDGFMALVAAPGMAKDAAGSLPSQFKPDTIYAGPLNQTPLSIDTGASDEITFRFRVAWSVSTKGEDGGKLRLRRVSAAQDAGALVVGQAVERNRTASGLWDWLQVASIQYDGFAQFDCRGAFIDLSGYRIVST
jgi:hypothetical protein